MGTSDTKFCSEIKRIIGTRKELDPYANDDKFGTAIKTRNSPGIINLNLPGFTDTEQEDENVPDDSFESHRLQPSEASFDSRANRNLKFDVFEGQNSQPGENESSSEIIRGDRTYFNIKDAMKTFSSRRSQSSQLYYESKDHDEYTPKSIKYISPENISRSKDKNTKKLFEYDSSKYMASYNYMEQECPGTPDKRNTRSSKNMDLLSPVTRILAVDSGSSKVRINVPIKI